MPVVPDKGDVYARLSPLEHLADFWDLFPFSALLWGHCLFVSPLFSLLPLTSEFEMAWVQCALMVVKLRGNYLFAYWVSPSGAAGAGCFTALTAALAQVGLLAAFGGGTVSALLIQDPKKAAIALFQVWGSAELQRSCELVGDQPDGRRTTVWALSGPSAGGWCVRMLRIWPGK